MAGNRLRPWIPNRENEMTQNTVPLPEPGVDLGYVVGGLHFTADQMHAYATKVCAEKDAEIERLRADAARYQWLRENCSYSYGMQPDSPAEHGIEYQWQQCAYEERDQGIDESIDAVIDAALKETK